MAAVVSGAGVQCSELHPVPSERRARVERSELLPVPSMETATHSSNCGKEAAEVVVVHYTTHHAVHHAAQPAATFVAGPAEAARRDTRACEHLAVVAA